MDTHYNRLTEAALTYTHILCFGRKNHILHPKIAIFKMIKVCSILHKHANAMKIHGENEFYIKRSLIYHTCLYIKCVTFEFKWKLITTLCIN